jgi:hypothetical protein
MKDDGYTIHIGDDYFPTGDSWVAFKTNRKLRRQTNWYLFEYICRTMGYGDFFVSFAGAEQRSREQQQQPQQPVMVQNQQPAPACPEPGAHREHMRASDELYETEFEVDGATMNYGKTIGADKFNLAADQKATFINNRQKQFYSSGGGGNNKNSEFEAMFEQDMMREDPTLHDDSLHRDKLREKVVIFDGGVHDSQIFDERAPIQYRCAEFRQTLRTDLPNAVPRRIAPRLLRSAMIGEGELALQYHAGFFPDRDHVMLTCDSDVIAISLLNSKADRWDAERNCWRNNVYVRIETGGAAANGGKKTYTFVDMNALHDGIERYYRQHVPGVKHPVEMHCMLMMLNGTDFTTQNWCHGKSHVTIFKEFVAAGKFDELGFGGMIRPCTEPRHLRVDDADPQVVCHARVVDIDANQFVRFSEELYVHFFGDAVRKKMDQQKKAVPSKPTPAARENIKKSAVAAPKTPKERMAAAEARLAQISTTVGYEEVRKMRTETQSNPNAHPPPSEKFKVYARNLMYVFLYWLNTHRLRLQHRGRYMVLFDCLAQSKHSQLPVWGYETVKEEETGRTRVVLAERIDAEIQL